MSMSVNLRVWNLELLWSPVLVLEFQIFTTGSAELDLNGWQVRFPPLSCYYTVHSQLSQALSFIMWACLPSWTLFETINISDATKKCSCTVLTIKFHNSMPFQAAVYIYYWHSIRYGIKHWKQILIFVTVLLVQLITNTATLLTLYIPYYFSDKIWSITFTGWFV
jgi:hypothetical protein